MQLKEMVKTDWTTEEIKAIYKRPLLQLISDAMSVHKPFHKPGEIQASSLISIKTGGCSEDCAYCPQSAKHGTVKASKLMPHDKVLLAAEKAKEEGAGRFCMGAAWREVRNNRDFEKVIEMVKSISIMGMEVCCSLGMISYKQATRLKEAGLTAYNHNIDTSEDYYKKIITTRSYENRLQTLKNIRKAGIATCTGGIIGMGETENDRIQMIHTLASLPEHPESVPVNILIPTEGAPIKKAEISIWDIVRTIATIRLTLPFSRIRLSAGRATLSNEEQALCFITGVNSVFIGEKLLTAPNASPSNDQRLFQLLGINIVK